MNKPVILQIITGLDFGGAEKVVLDLCEGLNSREYQVYLVSLSDKFKMVPEFEKKGIQLVCLNLQKNPVSFYNGLRSLSGFIKEWKVSVIHAHMFHALVISVLLRLFAKRIPIVFTPHNYKFGSNFRKWSIRLLKPFRSVDILFSKNHFQAGFKKEHIIIPNGIHIPSEHKKAKKFETFTFLAVGRLEPNKNHQKLIDLALKLKNNYTFKILIAGEGLCRKTLEVLIEKNGLQDHIKLLGLRKDIESLNLKSHVFIMPSLWEGLPIAMLEAGVAKLPVITTPVGSIPTLIDESTGYIGEIEEFHNFMAECIDNYPESISKGVQLFERIKASYSHEQFMETHVHLYETFI